MNDTSKKISYRKQIAHQHLYHQKFGNIGGVTLTTCYNSIGLDQGDTKPFWKYVRAQRQDNVGVAPLLDNGVLHTDSFV